MEEDGFLDFIIFYDLLFPDDETKTFKCSSCGRLILGNEQVEWVNKSRRAFKCPECGEELWLE